MAPWTDLLAASGKRVVLFDPTGTGASDRDVTDFSLERRVSDLECVVEKMVGGERFELIGWFHGGLAAASYAIGHPARLTHLVLWDAYARGIDYYNATPYTRAIEALSPLAAEDWDFFTLNLGHWATRFSDPELARRLARAFKQGLTPESYLSWVEQTKLVDLSSSLAQITVPTLVVQDRTAVLSMPEQNKALAPAIPGAQFATVGDRRGERMP